MTWLVLAALQAEIRPAVSRLQARPRRVAGLPCHEKGPLVLAAGGVGATAAARAAARLADGLKPDVLVSTGFAGALADGLATGDLLLGGSPGFPADEKALRAAREAAPEARIGAVLAVDRVLRDAKTKERLHWESGALAVDMESAAVAAAARECRRGFLCVKAILDTPVAPLASDYAGLSRVLLQILLHPSTLLRLPVDASRAQTAADRLAAFYARLADLLDKGWP